MDSLEAAKADKAAAEASLAAVMEIVAKSFRCNECGCILALEFEYAF